MDLLLKVIKWVVVLTFPFLLGFGTVRAIIASNYPAFEYPRITSDLYGWTDEERLELAEATLDYIQRPEPAEEVIFLLEDLRLPEDSETPLYNEREIGHMLDVKHLFDAIGRILRVLAVIIPIGLVTLFFLDRSILFETIRLSGWSTIILLAAICYFHFSRVVALLYYIS